MSEFAFADGVASPRKRPVQGRSRDTYAAILEAVFRVLADDPTQLTTTRVAEVAGVSVGTLYQYFPHRDALITGALADHLEAAIGAVEAAAAASQGEPIAVAAERIVRAFLAVKAERAPRARALNHVLGTGKLDDRPVVRAATQRAERAVASVLAGGGEPSAAILQKARIACTALEGVVRTAIEDDVERLRDPRWVAQVVRVAVHAIAG